MSEEKSEAQLTAVRVKELLKDCLFKDKADATEDNTVVVMGVRQGFGFNKEAVERNKEEITQLLTCLPETFSNGGHSFLAACMDKDGRQWGEHINVEELMCLGLATGLVEYCLPRDAWHVLPGGVPYFEVKVGSDGG